MSNLPTPSSTPSEMTISDELKSLTVTQDESSTIYAFSPNTYTVNARRFDELLARLRVLEAASSESVLAELRAEIFRTATTGFTASRFKKYVLNEIDKLNAKGEHQR